LEKIKKNKISKLSKIIWKTNNNNNKKQFNWTIK